MSSFYQIKERLRKELSKAQTKSTKIIRFNSKVTFCGSTQKYHFTDSMRNLQGISGDKTLHVKLIYRRLTVAVWVDQDSEKHPLCKSNFQESDSWWKWMKVCVQAKRNICSAGKSAKWNICLFTSEFSLLVILRLIIW